MEEGFGLLACWHHLICTSFHLTLSWWSKWLLHHLLLPFVRPLCTGSVSFIWALFRRVENLSASLSHRKHPCLPRHTISCILPPASWTPQTSLVMLGITSFHCQAQDLQVGDQYLSFPAFHSSFLAQGPFLILETLIHTFVLNLNYFCPQVPVVPPESPRPTSKLTQPEPSGPTTDITDPFIKQIGWEAVSLSLIIEDGITWIRNT